ncbi:hypothetical protein R1sor_017322 [Riccia sorocarpa]|uniref:Uncharacterized protein n=1 Tax=Riccia sorocarpa TaxID=122646 RepID=A0ABD3I6H3_9MARC
MTESRSFLAGGSCFGRKQISCLILLVFLQFAAFGTSTAGSSYPSDPLAELEEHDDSFFKEDGQLASAQKVVRHLLQTTGSSGMMIQENDTFLLAANRTNRRDPLDNFDTYRGGWNIQNKHYWASVGYTGLPAFIVALVWAALGLLGLLSLLLCCCCCGRKRPEYDHGRMGYIIPILLLLFFTTVAIVGCAVLYRGQARFNETLVDTLDFVVLQSETTEQGLRRVSRNLTRASEINIDNLFTLSAADKAEIQTLNNQLNNSANSLRDETRDNADSIKHIIDIVRIVLVVVATVMLLLVLLGLLFAACGIRWIVYLLVLLGWLLVTGTWILCGIFILLNNAIGDTCVAMEEWVARPFANTTLDEILPCADPRTANSALVNSKDYTDQIIMMANQGITRVANQNFPAGTPTYYNQSGPLVPILCDIYGPGPDFNLRTCSPPNLTLSAAPANWSGYICETNANGICQTQGRLTDSSYRQLATAADIGNSLFADGNFLVSVANCSFVRDAFTEIRGTYCHNLRRYVKWVWVGLILVSGGSMLSILLWMVYIRRKRYRYSPGRGKYGKSPPPYNGLQPAPNPT